MRKLLIVIVVIVLLWMASDYLPQQAGAERTQATMGAMVMNEVPSVKCDNNENTDIPWCYFTPYDPYVINGGLP